MTWIYQKDWTKNQVKTKKCDIDCCTEIAEMLHFKKTGKRVPFSSDFLSAFREDQNDYAPGFNPHQGAWVLKNLGICREELLNVNVDIKFRS
jgi:hypothetical protein